VRVPPFDLGRSSLHSIAHQEPKKRLSVIENCPYEHKQCRKLYLIFVGLDTDKAQFLDEYVERILRSYKFRSVGDIEVVATELLELFGTLNSLAFALFGERRVRLASENAVPFDIFPSASFSANDLSKYIDCCIQTARVAQAQASGTNGVSEDSTRLENIVT
jgi:hypothetical protein